VAVIGVRVPSRPSASMKGERSPAGQALRSLDPAPPGALCTETFDYKACSVDEILGKEQGIAPWETFLRLT